MSELASTTFRAMGTEIRTVLPATLPERVVKGAFERVTDIFAREEQRFSRFRGDSELTSVNANAGRWTNVSAGLSGS